jgi:hypothetical protein
MASYAILALIIGLENFMALVFIPDGLGDERDVCRDFLNHILANK